MLKNVTMQELQDMMANLMANSAKTDKQIAETDKQIAETEKQLAKTDAKLDKVAKMIGGVSNNQGDIAEEFFVNSLTDSKKIGDIQYDMIFKNLSKHYKGVQDEYDIVLVNGKDIAIIEVKYKAHQNDLEQLLNKKYENFKKLYPEYAHYRHHLGLASFHINDELKNDALSSGVTILQRKGDLIESFNPSK